MTDAKIAEWRALCEKTTEGPWEVYRKHYRDARIRSVKDVDAEIATMGNWNGEYETEQRINAEFIAHARTALPAVLDALEEARKALRFADYALMGWGHGDDSKLAEAYSRISRITAAFGGKP